MNKKSLIYVAGHSGLIGSAIMRRLKSSGYGNILIRSHKELDLAEQNKVRNFFAKERPEYVFLAAAQSGGIHANSVYPAEFIYNNLMIQANVINSAHRYCVKKLLFLASSCVYPKFSEQPMNEKCILSGPVEPTNEPFAVAKIAGIKMCQSYNRQYKTSFLSVIPSNVYGILDHYDDSAHVVASLIKKFHEAKRNNLREVIIWGTGKPMREFIYVDDVAAACSFLMNNYDSEDPINIGTGIETSIADLAALIRKISGFRGSVVYDTSRPDGNHRRFLDTGRINALKWKAKVSLDQGIRIAYKWYDEQVTVGSKL